MDYREALKNLREQVFAEPEKVEKPKSGFIPARASVTPVSSQMAVQKSVEWLRQIKTASEEIQSKNRKVQEDTQATIAEPTSYQRKSPTVLDDMPEANKEAYIKRRGGGPSGYTPDRPLTPSSKPIDLKGKEEFISSLYPTAVEVGNEIGIDPRIIMAQAALETGWGKSAPNNNYFGIKSHGEGGGAIMSTQEVVDGRTVTEQASFRQYENPADSVRGYGEFLTSNPRYRNMLAGKTLEEQVRELGKSGYATDPRYADKIYAIATSLPPLVNKRGK